MKKMVLGMVGLRYSVLIGGFANTPEKGLFRSVADGCKAEIDTYCKDVTPGEGRVLACLFAREDKLSMRCQYALFDASAQLQQAVAALTYLANECRDDLK